MGSKSRIAKHIVPIIQAEIDKGATCYIEPFVGGANVIDKIKCETKIGYDSNEYLIALLKHVRDGGELPEEITRDTYAAIRSAPGAYEKWLVGAAGFLASYNGKFFGGYAGIGYEKNGRKRDYYAESKKNIESQKKNIKDVSFISCSYNVIAPPPAREQ